MIFDNLIFSRGLSKRVGVIELLNRIKWNSWSDDGKSDVCGRSGGGGNVCLSCSQVSGSQCRVTPPPNNDPTLQTKMTKIFPPWVPIRHLIQDWVDTVIRTGEGPEKFLEAFWGVLGRLLVDPPPESHGVVGSPANDEARHQHSHHLHRLDLGPAHGWPGLGTEIFSGSSEIQQV